MFAVARQTTITMLCVVLTLIAASCSSSVMIDDVAGGPSAGQHLADEPSSHGSAVDPDEPVSTTFDASPDALELVDPKAVLDRVILSEAWQTDGNVTLNTEGDPNPGEPLEPFSGNASEWCPTVWDNVPVSAYSAHRSWKAAEATSSTSPSDHYLSMLVDSWADVSHVTEFSDRFEADREHCTGVTIVEEHSAGASSTYLQTRHEIDGLIVDFVGDPDGTRGNLWAVARSGSTTGQVFMDEIPEHEIEANLPVIAHAMTQLMNAIETEAATGTPLDLPVISSHAYERATSIADRLALPARAEIPGFDEAEFASRIERAYPDRYVQFTAEQLDCIAATIALAKPSSDSSNDAGQVQRHARWCAPAAHADWWAEGNEPTLADINLDDLEQRRCVAHTAYRLESERWVALDVAGAVDEYALTLTWPDPAPEDRRDLLLALESDCELSETLAVGAGLIPG